MPSPRRLLALVRKEFQQLGRNRQLVFQLIFPPTIGLCIFGFALNPSVKGLRLGVVDESPSQTTRELVSALTAGEAFRVEAHYASGARAAEQLRDRRIDLAVVIPSDFTRRRALGEPVDIQVLVDAVNANSANIAQGYLTQVAAATATRGVRRIDATAKVLFNPGIAHAWFFVTGVISILIFVNSALTAAALTVREKELGTIEQLLMSPAQTIEVLVAKTVPVLCTALVVLAIGLGIARAVFDVPIRGPAPVLVLSSLLSSLAGIGVGITMATFSSSQQQAQILTFFLMPPLVLVSGAVSPAESMPWLLQQLSVLDPLRYMAQVMRGVTVRGSGLAALSKPLAILAGYSMLFYAVSAWRFRRQLS
jgi:ABC-2 type transport system permease protein